MSLISTLRWLSERFYSIHSTTAVARGDLSKTIDVNAQGEILQLKDTVNNMVDSLNNFSSEVTRCVRLFPFRLATV